MENDILKGMIEKLLGKEKLAAQDLMEMKAEAYARGYQAGFRAGQIKKTINNAPNQFNLTDGS